MPAKGDVYNQYLAAISVNILSISFGCAQGWISASYLDLQDVSSPLITGPITKEQLGWVSAALFLGCLVGGILFGWLAKKIGCKRSLLITAIPLLLHGIIIPLARDPMQLFLARFLAGIAGGSCNTVIPIYITELAEDGLRSTLGTFQSLCLAFGMLLINVLGYYFHYITVAWILLAIPIIFLPCFIFIPDTPQYLALKNYDRAEKSLRYYRGISSKDKTTEQFNQELMKLCKSGSPTKSKHNRLNWADYTHLKARKAYFIALGLLLCNQLPACQVIMNYMTLIFKDSGSNLSPMASSIVVSISQLLGALSSTLFVERAGRKTLMIISTFGVFLGEFAMAFYYNLTAQGYETSFFSWLPVVALSFIMFTANCGILTLVPSITAEISPLDLRYFIITVQSSTRLLLNTFLIKLFPPLSDSIGIAGTLFLYAGFSILLTLFLLIFLPETKGKTLDEIQDSL